MIIVYYRYVYMAAPDRCSVMTST